MEAETQSDGRRGKKQPEMKRDGQRMEEETRQDEKVMAWGKRD